MLSTSTPKQANRNFLVLYVILAYDTRFEGMDDHLINKTLEILGIVVGDILETTTRYQSRAHRTAVRDNQRADHFVISLTLVPHENNLNNVQGLVDMLDSESSTTYLKKKFLNELFTLKGMTFVHQVNRWI